MLSPVGTDLSRPLPHSRMLEDVRNVSTISNIAVADKDAMNRSLQVKASTLPLCVFLAGDDQGTTNSNVQAGAWLQAPVVSE